MHIKATSVEVRFQNVTVEASIFLGGRSMPSVGNTYLNFIEVCARFMLAQVSKMAPECEQHVNHDLHVCSPSSA